jgi:hypothetical protein
MRFWSLQIEWSESHHWLGRLAGWATDGFTSPWKTRQNPSAYGLPGRLLI